MAKKKPSFVPMAAFSQVVGFKVVEWRRDHCALELRIKPHHRNRSGVVHGGVSMTLIDAACGYSGSYTEPGEPPKLSSSLSITVGFVGNVKSGVLRAVARRTGGGSRTFFATAQVLDEKGNLIAQGESVFRYRSPEAAEAALKRAKRMRLPAPAARSRS